MKKILFLSLTLILVGSRELRANHINPGVAGAHTQRLVESLDNIVYANHLVHQGAVSEASTRLRVAGYRVRIVLADLSYSGLHDAERALRVVEEKLSDPYLGLREKITISLDCLGVALPIIVEATVTEFDDSRIRAAKTNLYVAKKLSAAYRFQGAIRALTSADLILRRVYCPAGFADLRRAQEAIGVAIAKASDATLSAVEKDALVQDCSNVAEDRLRILEGSCGGGCDSSATTVLTCESYNYTHQQCIAPGLIQNAEVVHQFSSTYCRLGRTYGFQGNTLWVNQGCRAKFRVTYRR